MDSSEVKFFKLYHGQGMWHSEQSGSKQSHRSPPSANHILCTQMFLVVIWLPVIWNKSCKEMFLSLFWFIAFLWVLFYFPLSFTSMPLILLSKSATFIDCLFWCGHFCIWTTWSISNSYTLWFTVFPSVPGCYAHQDTSISRNPFVLSPCTATCAHETQPIQLSILCLCVSKHP